MRCGTSSMALSLCTACSALFGQSYCLLCTLSKCINWTYQQFYTNAKKLLQTRSFFNMLSLIFPSFLLSCSLSFTHLLLSIFFRWHHVWDCKILDIQNLLLLMRFLKVTWVNSSWMSFLQWFYGPLQCFFMDSLQWYGKK